MLGLGLSLTSVAMLRTSTAAAANTYYIQADYGAAGDGVTNDSAAFSAFETDHQASTDLITLNIEPGTYVQGTNWMEGIDRLLVQGGPATFADNRKVGYGGGQRQSAQYSLRLEAVAAGDTVLTVKDVDPATLPAFMGTPSGMPDRDLATLMALVTPGSWVLLSAWDTMGFGYPTNPQVFEFAEVASVGVNTITLTSPTRFAYSDDFPVYWNGAALQAATDLSGVSGTFVEGETVTASGGATGLIVHSYPSSFQGATNGIRFTYASLAGKAVAAGETLTGATSGATATVVLTGPNGGLGGYRNLEADQGGPATLYALAPDWDAEVTLRNLTWPTLASGSVAMGARALTFESVDFSGMTSGAGGVWPSAAKTLTFTNCTLPTLEHDKHVETLTITGGTAVTHLVQSASIETMVVTNHTCTGFNGTPKNIEMDGVTASGTVRLGPTAYGVAESAIIENSSAGTLAASLRTVSLTGVTFSEGVFSKSDAGEDGVAVFGREWAFPGSKIVIANSSGQALAIAEITDFVETSGTAYVTTTLAELPSGADRIYPHPCWDVTASGNTGALAVLNGSVNQPLYAHANLTAAGSMTLWGDLDELRVNVTGTYAGNLTISGPADSGTWTATINLAIAGERVISASGNSGAQSGDTLPAAEWFRGAFTASAAGGTFTITADTTVDLTAPAISGVSYDGATETLNVTSSETGTLYWASADPEDDPTRTQIKAGTGGGIYEAGSFAVASGSSTPTIPLTDPTTPAGSRELSFFVEDAKGNWSAVQRVAFTMPDEVAPTITFSATASVAENATLSHSLTSGESVTWAIRTAAENAASVDHAHFEISGSTLRWLSDGTKDYEAPGDADANNTYVVVVRATDAASNTADQTITVTVTDVAEGGSGIGTAAIGSTFTVG